LSGCYCGTHASFSLPGSHRLKSSVTRKTRAGHLDYAGWKDRKLLAAALLPIYTVASAEAAEQALDAFERDQWGRKYPTVVAAW